VVRTLGIVLFTVYTVCSAEGK